MLGRGPARRGRAPWASQDAPKWSPLGCAKPSTSAWSSAVASGDLVLVHAGMAITVLEDDPVYERRADRLSCIRSSPPESATFLRSSRRPGRLRLGRSSPTRRRCAAATLERSADALATRRRRPWRVDLPAAAGSSPSATAAARPMPSGRPSCSAGRLSGRPLAGHVVGRRSVRCSRPRQRRRVRSGLLPPDHRPRPSHPISPSASPRAATR